MPTHRFWVTILCALVLAPWPIHGAWAQEQSPPDAPVDDAPTPVVEKTAEEEEVPKTEVPSETPPEEPDTWPEPEEDWGDDDDETFELRWGGGVQSDVRFRTEEKTLGSFPDKRTLPTGVERSENRLKLKLTAPGDRFTGVVDLDFVWTGRVSGMEDFSELTLRERTAPFRLEAHSLFIEARDVVVDGLDLRIGQQKVMWGVGDQFNPLNNLNAEDLEDALLFGDQQANMMARVDYSPFIGSESLVLDQLTITGVVVPLFKPALLPDSGVLALADVQRLPHLDDAERWFAGVAQAAGGVIQQPTVVTGITPEIPEASFANIQYGAQIQTNILEQDVAVSYYRGRSDMPVPIRNHTEQVPLTDEAGAPTELCDPADPDTCIIGRLETAVTLGYPRIQVAGLNLAGELPLLSWLSSSILPLGYRLEAALIVPEKTRLDLTHGPLRFGPSCVTEEDFATDPFCLTPEDPVYLGDEPPLVLDDAPLVKWTLGLDYSFGEHMYVNAQWVHGFVDELGAGDFITPGVSARRVTVDDPVSALGCALEQNGEKCATEITRPILGDYLVVGVDFKFMDQQALIRLFGILELNGYDESRWDPEADQRTSTHLSPLSPEGFSAVIFPSAAYNFGAGFELSAGGLLKLGKDYTKFGDPAAGGSLVWTKASYQF